MLPDTREQFELILSDFLEIYPIKLGSRNITLYYTRSKRPDDDAHDKAAARQRHLWNIADQLRGAMNADDFRDYMLAFLFLRYLSDNYEMAVAGKELGAGLSHA